MDRPARIVMVVANDVEGDSRVLKSARAAQDAGYEVVVVGVAQRRPPGSMEIDGVRVERVRVPYPLHEAVRRGTDLPGLVERMRYARTRAVSLDLRATAADRPGPAGALRTGDRLHARLRQTAVHAWWHTTGGGPVPRAARRLRDGARLRLAPLAGPRAWAGVWPLFLDYEVALTPVVVDLAPDLVHAHDVHLSHVADRAAGILRRSGHACRWVYDAHEWLPGVPLQEDRQRIGTRLLERDQVRRADAVLTVSELLADRVQQHYGLVTRPSVVQNAPTVGRVPAPDRRPLREELGLAREVPLLVYSGALAERRGVLDVVRAMPALPGVHLAVVANPSASFLRTIEALALEEGVADRVHARPYVPPSAVTWYLAGADAGLAPFHRTDSHDVALATKVREYLHAGLPLVASDCLEMARFVRATGIGEVFTARDVPDLARAAGAVLADGAYRDRITPELLAEHSWEREAEVLLDLYARLLGTPQGATVSGR